MCRLIENWVSYSFIFHYEIIMVSWLRSQVLHVSQVNLGFFYPFFNWIFFFNFIIQHWVYWEFDFIIIVMICFYRFIPVLRPEFDRLTRVDPKYFLIDFFFHCIPSTLGWLGIELHNFFIYFLLIYHTLIILAAG